MLSLVQTSRARAFELKRFLDSLNAQVGIDFKDIQLIFIDQGDNREIFRDINSEIDFEYIKTTPCSLSKARNVGLKYVKCEYVGFPDDDCWYEPDTLSKVFSLLHGKYDGVVCYGSDENNKPTNSFAQYSQKISKYNHCGAISYTIFLKFIKELSFDENLGVGSSHKFLSGEETDYLIKFIENSSSDVFYSRDICVHHPLAKSDYFDSETKKAYYYARGRGYLLRKHSYPFILKFKALCRPVVGILFYSICLKLRKAKRSWNILKGRLDGYRESKSFLCK